MIQVDLPAGLFPVAFFTVIFVMLMVLLGNPGYIFGHWCYKTDGSYRYLV